MIRFALFVTLLLSSAGCKVTPVTVDELRFAIRQAKRERAKATTSTSATALKKAEEAVATAKESIDSSNKELGGEALAESNRVLDEQVKQIKKSQKELIDEQIRKEIRKQLDNEGIATRTAAALVFVPDLEVAQAALVQSFSLRNLFQLCSPHLDPADIRSSVRSQLQSEQVYLGKLKRSAGETDLKKALTDIGIDDVNTVDELIGDPSWFDPVVEAIVEHKRDATWWMTRTDILSLDVGITSDAIGGASSSFSNRVDSEFPQVIFGLGAHFGALQFSAGTYMYRSSGPSKGNFRTKAYFSVSIDLFDTVLQGMFEEDTE